MTRIVVLDYGSGNVRSVVRMLERIGADVELTNDRRQALRADGLYVPGVGNFHACMAGLRAVDAPALIAERLRVAAPVLGVCVGHQVLFDGSSEPHESSRERGIGAWGGMVERLHAPVVPHMGWSQVQVTGGDGSALFSGVSDQRFYFVHSYAAPNLTGSQWRLHGVPPVVHSAQHGEFFIAAVEDGPLTGTQFHPEKSGDAGARLLQNWLARC